MRPGEDERTPGQLAGLDRERTIRILDELQGLQRSDRRYGSSWTSFKRCSTLSESRELPPDEVRTVGMV
jgi:hypothetical protein